MTDQPTRIDDIEPVKPNEADSSLVAINLLQDFGDLSKRESTSSSLVDLGFATPEIISNPPEDQEILIARDNNAQDVAHRAYRAYIDWGSGALGRQRAEAVLNNSTSYAPSESEGRTLNANAWNAYDGGQSGICLPVRNSTPVNVTAGKVNGAIVLTGGGDCN